MIRAANAFASSGLGEAILIGREEQIKNVLSSSGLELQDNVSVLNARLSDRNEDYASFLLRAAAEAGVPRPRLSTAGEQ